MNLSEPQQAAVAHMAGPALVVAGAGSGKTRTLTAKIDHLIRNGYEPERILAITFTNKAAEEMKGRLRATTGLAAERFPWVRTFHSACYRILRTHGERLGYGRPIQIYGSYAQKKLIADLLLRFNTDKKNAMPAMFQISAAKNSGTPESYFNGARKIGRIRPLDLYMAYERALMERNAVDFDNILLRTRDLLRDHGDLREKYREYFRYILVDEYQDSNDLQEELTRLLVSDGNLFCVGDDWQAIYGFRGSNVRHFLSFEKIYRDARLFRLEENYRSADEIVQAAAAVIDRNEAKVDKACFSRKRGGSVELHDFFDENQEAAWVARKIAVLRRGDIPYARMAVLYRTKFCSLAFEKAFRSRNIPYTMLGSTGFFERKEVLDIHSYLAAAVFPKDDVAFDRILNVPKRGIGPKMVERILDARIGGASFQDAARKVVAERVLTPKVHKALDLLLKTLDEIRGMKPAPAMETVIDRFDYMEHLRGYAKTPEDRTAREENLEQLKYAAGAHARLEDYLEEAALVHEDREDEDETGGGVRMATVHASKGLEFAVVFVVGCEENLFPHWRSMERPGDMQEERRLMYVAMTRAEKMLYLTRADFRRGQSNPPSRFWDEVEEAVESRGGP
jgi:DNA helicase II / ATP-dependent DNA helicase PcrA